MKQILFLIIFPLLGMTPCTHVKSNGTKVINIGFTGDVMLGRAVNQTINEKGYSYPWGNMLPFLKEHDFNIINLETTLTKSDKAVPKVFNFKADPDKIEVLRQGKISLANLANNHILDFAEEGLKETIKTLDTALIVHVGAGNNLLEAKKPYIFSINDTNFGVIGYTDNEPDWLATDNKPGTNYIKIGNIEQVKNDIAGLKDKVDILIVSIHWGPNMRERPTKEFQDFARGLINLGVDIFHGHSAHLFQGVEVYKNKLILYDTGDFVDDYAVDPYPRNDYAFLFRVGIVEKRLQSLTLIPALISNMQVNKAVLPEQKAIIERMIMLSKEWDTKFIEKDDLLVLQL